MNRSKNPDTNEEQVMRIRHHLQKPDTQTRVFTSIQSARTNATVTTSGAAKLLDLGEQQLRDWEKRGLISTMRPLKAGKETPGHRQFGLDELDRLAVIKELVTEGGFSPGDIENISNRIYEVWRELAATEPIRAQGEPEEQVHSREAIDLPIDQLHRQARAKLFWRYYTSHALRLSLYLIGEDLPRESIGLLLPLRPEASERVTQIENIHLLGESLVGWLGHSRSTHTLLTHRPVFTFNTDFRIQPLPDLASSNLSEQTSSDHTHIVMRREARELALKPEVVEMIHELLKPLYEDVELTRSCFDAAMYEAPEASPDLDNSAMYPDLILDGLADMIVRLGGRDHEREKQHWWFCCILLPKDPVRPMQQRTLVVRAQSVNSPHKVGIASVSPTVELSSLSLHAYQSGQVCYRNTVSPEDSVIAFHDVEHNIQSAIAIPVGAEYGEPVAVIYVASELEGAFSGIQDRRLLRLLGRMSGELIKSYQVKRQEVEKLEEIFAYPDVVDDVVGIFYSENKFIDDLENELLSFQAGRQQLEQPEAELVTEESGLTEIQKEKYIISLIGIDIDHVSSPAAKYGNNAMRNLYREIAVRIRTEMASTFRMYPESKFYRIYADRFVVLLKSITYDQLISKARLLKKSLDGIYKVNLLSTQQPPPFHLEELKITVRLAVSAYDKNTLERLLDEYHSNSGASSVRETMEHSLTTELKKGMTEGGNCIRGWDPTTRSYNRWDGD